MPPKKRKLEDGTEDSEVNETEEGNNEATGSEVVVVNKEPNCDNGGAVLHPGPSDPDANDEDMTGDAADIADTHDPEKPEKKKFRLKVPEHSGVMVFFGGTNWDLIGRRELPKTAKGAGGRNLWGPHCLGPLKGVRVRTVVSGNSACHSIIVTEDGTVMSWGRNDKGQLGHGDTKRRDIPTPIETLKEYCIVDAACGRSHSLVLTDRGQVYSFGDNKLGQCGVGNQTSGVIVPTKVSFKGRPVIKMAAGGEFSVLLDVKGYIFSFGCPEYGQLGHNTDGRYFVTSNKLAYSCELVPRRIGIFIEKTREGHILPVEDVHIVEIACGTNHTIAMDSKKRCYTWGFGGYGRLGHAEPKDEMVPRLVKFFDGPGRGVRAVYSGGSYSMIISEHGALYFWGQNKPGGEATMYPKPVHDLTGWNVRFVGCCNRSIVTVCDESVISWGSSPTYGELGYGENKPKSSTTPQEVKPLDGLFVHGISCGYGHTLLIVKDETDEEKAKINKFPVYSP